MRKSKKGFSLLELMIVVVILGFISSLVGMKGWGYYKLFSAREGEKQYQRMLDYCTELAKIENTLVTIEIQNLDGGYTYMIPSINGQNGHLKFHLKPQKIQKKTIDRKILIFPDGRLESTEK
ncbi:MAG: type II secretion system protein [Chlamydiia bacterium]